ncbi:MAG TPA: TerB family tellurite resistance protein, partial [Kofleriaceae bacterium]
KVAKCLLIAKVLVADGIMTDDERGFLDGVMAAEGLDADERRQVIELEGWDDAERLVRGLPIEQRRALVEQLVDAASADGRLSPHELATIRQLAADLGV